jgi:uncharacterized radical SAM superfamily Fe-S cluster-containing enzyme
MQHSCLSVVEITDNCNLNCPVCYAESGTHRERHKPLDEVIRMLDAVVANEGEADVMQLSGGEPTLHPQFWQILDAAKARPIKHVMVNTNGIVLAQDKEFVRRLAGYAPGIEVYLQFDSLRAEVHKELRGADLTRIRRQALDNLNEAGLSTTLVVTLKKGLNDGEIGEIIDFALRQPCVRGVTLQPIQDAGRVEDYDPRLHRLTVSEIRRKIAEQSSLFTLQDVVPVPCNPDTLAMAYAIKTPSMTVPLTRWLDPQTLVEGSGNTIVFERDDGLREAVKDQVFKLFSTNHSPESQANCLSELMCCLPLVSAPSELRYDNVFRVLIVQFMDAYSLDVRALKKSCIHFAQPDGKMVPFESYNLLYRDGRKLAGIRDSIATQFAQRRRSATIPLVPVE